MSEVKGTSVATAQDVMGAIYQSAMPVARERYARKIQLMGKPVMKPDPHEAHRRGYGDGFCDAIFYITTGQIEIATFEVNDGTDSDNARK